MPPKPKAEDAEDATPAAAEPARCVHDYKKTVDKDGKPTNTRQDNGAPANVRCTKCKAQAWRG